MKHSINAAVIMVVVPVNGPITVYHIAELNAGVCLAKQGVCPKPIRLGPWYHRSFPGNCDEHGTNMKIRSVWLLSTSLTARLTH